MHNARGQIDDRIGNDNLIWPRGASNRNRRGLRIEALLDRLGDQRGQRFGRHVDRRGGRRIGEAPSVDIVGQLAVLGVPGDILQAAGMPAIRQ